MPYCKERCDSKRLRVETMLKRSNISYERYKEHNTCTLVNVLDLIVLLLACPEVLDSGSFARVWKFDECGGEYKYLSPSSLMANHSIIATYLVTKALLNIHSTLLTTHL